MAIDFNKFDKKMGSGFAEKVKEAAENSYDEVPKGNYVAKLEKMELGMTKDGKRPMFKVQMRLVEGIGEDEDAFVKKFSKKKPCIFMNRVLFGTKNDEAMIGSVITWLNKLLSPGDEAIVFTSFSDLNEDVLDLAEDFGNAEIEIEYDAKAFNSISVKKVF